MANSFSFERQRIVSRGMDGVKAVKIREGERSASDSILFLWHTCGWHKEQTFVNRLTRLKKKKKKGRKNRKIEKKLSKGWNPPLKRTGRAWSTSGTCLRSSTADSVGSLNERLVKRNKRIYKCVYTERDTAGKCWTKSILQSSERMDKLHSIIWYMNLFRYGSWDSSQRAFLLILW